MSGEQVETVWRGRFLETKRRGKWEYVTRTGDLHAAVILAIDDGHVLLVEQYRVPLGRACLELPAGIVGDEQAGESVEASAARELEEETGYRADAVDLLGDYYSSPGLTSEIFTVVRATALTRTGDGGGTDAEDIAVHHVRIDELPGFIRRKRTEGLGIDSKLWLLLGLDAL